MTRLINQETVLEIEKQATSILSAVHTATVRLTDYSFVQVVTNIITNEARPFIIQEGKVYLLPDGDYRVIESKDILEFTVRDGIIISFLLKNPNL